MARSRSTHSNRCSNRRCGITLIESLLAMSITTIAGSALLTSIGSAVASSTDAVYRTVGDGLAEQLMDEIASVRFPDSATSAIASTGKTRERFDDIDDYAGWSSSPPVARAGQAVGTEGFESKSGHVLRNSSMRPNPNFLNTFTREVAVERVRPDGNGGWLVTSQPTDFRRVTVSVIHTDTQGSIRPLAEFSRIFTYVSIAP